MAIDSGELAGLRLLVETVRAGSLSGAARALGTSQPAASQLLRRLERRMGLALLVRTPQGSRPTPAGERLAGIASDALAALDRVHVEAAALRAAARGEVRVAASLTIAEYVLPPRLAELPDVTVKVAVTNSDEVIARVRSRQVDLGFVEGPVDVAGLRVRRIGEDELAVVVAPGHPWARLAAHSSAASRLPAAELAATALLLRERESGTRRTFADALTRAGLVGVEPLGVLTSTEALKAAVRAGVGATVVSRLAVAEDVAAGLLVEVPVEGLDLRRPLRAVWLPGGCGPAGLALVRVVSLGGPGAGA
ncbi:MAG TPA: LysR family transcriptional regulator [Micromonosporaceae bacterium]